MVRRCISQLSYPLFDKSDRRNIKNRESTYITNYLSRSELKKKNMPLTIRSVVLLDETCAFSESEIAEVLNITPVQVKERLDKARLMVSDASVHCNRITT
jgi:hypothetical protein